MSTDNEPLTPGEARAREARTRRELWIGLAVMVAVVVLLILVVMEVRYRASLDDPRPSAALDESMTALVSDLGPLPGDADTIELATRRDGGARYQVVVRDDDGERLFSMARGVETAGVIEHGGRAGEPINYRIELSVADDGSVTGAYRPDRGVPVERYRDVAAVVLRQALVAWHAHASHPLPSRDETSPQAIQEGWDAVMDEGRISSGH